MAYVSMLIATTAGLLIALLFALTLPDDLLVNGSIKTSEVHLACAGIIGTALALVLSLSIVPAQKAADVFSSGILKLYARDPTTLWVFALLSCASLLSLLLGTNWTFLVSARYTLAAQFFILGASLDALRAFYTRALELLVPATALGLVSRECNGYIDRARRQIERLVRINQITSAPGSDSSVPRWAFYSKSQISRRLIAWITQLEEFAHKGVARRDTQAVNAITTTMAAIGMRYADSRRDSMVLVPDFSMLFAGGVSDIGEVLNPIYESIKSVCDDAAKHSSEAIVQGCIQTLGDMAAHAMTMVSAQDRSRSAPLAFTAAFYMDLCAQRAIESGMEDAVLAAIESTRKIFAQISADTNTRDVESKALDCLFKIAVASYTKLTVVSCFRSVEMMLFAAQHDLRIGGFYDEAIFTKTLKNVASLMPLEAAMDKAGQRQMQTFPPYSSGFAANIPTLLAGLAKQVKPVDEDRSWIDPFHEFVEASEEILDHYWMVAESVSFDGALFQKWVVDSIIAAAEVHLHLLANPPAGSESFLDTVDDRLRGFIAAPSFYFRESKAFPARHAADAAGALAILGMKLLKLQRLQSAQECGKAIAEIARKCAVADKKPYNTANVLMKLEQLARAADALGYPQLIANPELISEEALPGYLEAMKTRIRQLDKALRERGRDIPLPHDPVPLLRRILSERRAPSSTSVTLASHNAAERTDGEQASD